MKNRLKLLAGSILSFMTLIALGIAITSLNASGALLGGLLIGCLVSVLLGFVLFVATFNEYAPASPKKAVIETLGLLLMH